MPSTEHDLATMCGRTEREILSPCQGRGQPRTVNQQSICLNVSYVTRLSLVRFVSECLNVGAMLDGAHRHVLATRDAAVLSAQRLFRRSRITPGTPFAAPVWSHERSVQFLSFSSKCCGIHSLTIASRVGLHLSPRRRAVELSFASAAFPPPQPQSHVFSLTS